MALLHFFFVGMFSPHVNSFFPNSLQRCGNRQSANESSCPGAECPGFALITDYDIVMGLNSYYFVYAHLAHTTFERTTWQAPKAF